MAKVSAHGAVIGTIETLTKSLRYMSDGKVLKNDGFGWKLAKLKPDALIGAAGFERARAKQEAFLKARPAYAAYRKVLHDLAPISKRWKLHAAVELMPDDADGVWSEACDGYGDNVHADVDDVVALCRTFKVALIEKEEIKKEAGPL